MSSSTDGDIVLPKFRTADQIKAQSAKFASEATAGMQMPGDEGEYEEGGDLGGGLAGRLMRIKDPLSREIMKSVFEVHLSRMVGKSIEIPDPAELQVRSRRARKEAFELEEQIAQSYVTRVEGRLAELSPQEMAQYGLRQGTDFFLENPQGAMAAADELLKMKLTPYTLRLAGRKTTDIGMSMEEQNQKILSDRKVEDEMIDYAGKRSREKLASDVQVAENLKKVPDIQAAADERLKQYEEQIEGQTGKDIAPAGLFGSDFDSEDGARSWATTTIKDAFAEMVDSGLSEGQVSSAIMKRYSGELRDHLEEAELDDRKRITFNPEDPDSRAAWWHTAGLISLAGATNSTLGNLFTEAGVKATSIEPVGFAATMIRIAQEMGFENLQDFQLQVLGPTFPAGLRRERELQEKVKSIQR